MKGKKYLWTGMEYSTQRDVQRSAGQATCGCSYPPPSSPRHRGEAQLPLPLPSSPPAALSFPREFPSLLQTTFSSDSH